MLYHVSKISGLTTLVPQVSTHGKPYVYAVENLVTGLLFGAPHDDFDFIIDVEHGIPVIAECYPDAFRSLFSGKACSVFELNEAGFRRGMTAWDAELVNENEVAVVREIRINDLYSRLLAEEKCGNLVICRYENTPAHKRRVAEHIVDRLIRFDAVQTQDPRLLAHYAPILTALKSITDGHLL